MLARRAGRGGAGGRAGGRAGGGNDVTSTSVHVEVRSDSMEHVFPKWHVH